MGFDWSFFPIPKPSKIIKIMVLFDIFLFTPILKLSQMIINYKQKYMIQNPILWGALIIVGFVAGYFIRQI